MSTRENILAAVATALAGVASGRIYRTRREQLGTLPAIVVEPVSEQAEELSLGYIDRRLTVGINVYAKGDTPDNAADSTLGSAWAALAATPTLGLGTEVQLESPHGIDWDVEDYDYVRATLSVTYNYRTALGSM
jgi:hypothetical protein